MAYTDKEKAAPPVRDESRAGAFSGVLQKTRFCKYRSRRMKLLNAGRSGVV